MKLSITKHNPNKFEDVGKICFEMFFLLSVSDIQYPPVSAILNRYDTYKL